MHDFNAYFKCIFNVVLFIMHILMRLLMHKLMPFAIKITPIMNILICLNWFYLPAFLWLQGIKDKLTKVRIKSITYFEISFILIRLIIWQSQIQTSCFLKFSFRRLRNFLLLERNYFYVSSIRNVISLTSYHKLQFRKFLNNPLHQKHVKTYFQNIF